MGFRVAIANQVKPDITDWDSIDLYRFFAFVFDRPTRERFEWFSQPNISEWLQQLWNNLGSDKAFPLFEKFPDYDAYEASYIALFDVGMPAPPVPLSESGHDRSQPSQNLALENVNFYAVLELKADMTRNPPDHLVTQLEFLSAVRYARENAADPENRRQMLRLETEFLDRHLLNWVPLAQKKLSKEDPPVFSVLMTLLLEFLHQQRAHLP
jgi:DMSO reductase family type II enzyme chaperone